MDAFSKEALEARLIDLLTSVQAGSVTPVEAMLVIRGEVITNYFRGLNAQKKTPRQKRDASHKGSVAHTS